MLTLTEKQLLSISKKDKHRCLGLLSIVDKEIVAAKKDIEVGNFNACQGYKMAKRIKELRIKRREIKNRMKEIAHTIQYYKR